MKFLKYILPAALACLAAACDDIDEADRWQPSEEVQVKKNVLIEDFTGQNCVNCPAAHDIITNIQTALGHEHVIAVSIHGGALAINDNGTSNVGLAVEESNALNAQFAVPNWPLGMVDRKGETAYGLLSAPEAWTKLAVQFCQLAPKVDIRLHNVGFDPETRKVTLTAEVEGFEAAEGTLHVWLTESNIVAPQRTPEGMQLKYEHNHVYRAAVNTPEGTPLAVAKGENRQVEMEYTLLRPYWNEANLSLVAFFTNTTDGVMQVIEEKLPNAEN